jgi:hypothetical protein
MQTYQNIMLLSNPNTYPDFQKAKSAFEQKQKPKFGFKLPALLGSNPYISTAYSLVSSFFTEGDSKEKEAEMEKISCIMDFTVRMNGDLNTIYHETEYLKTSNTGLKADCEKLFEDYTKAIGYAVTIEKCRKGDDWESVFEALDVHMKKIEEAGKVPALQPQEIKLKNALEFATNRVADMVSKYRNYVTQGTLYYKKFDNIVSTYENESTCQEKLPRQFSELKMDIKMTIEKFTNTYNLPEIEGSKLRDLMFGMLE